MNSVFYTAMYSILYHRYFQCAFAFFPISFCSYHLRLDIYNVTGNKRVPPYLLGSYLYSVQICSEADYCSPEKKKKNEVLQRVCGSAKTEYRHNKNEDGFPLQYNCKYVCGAAENAIKNQE